MGLGLGLVLVLVDGGCKKVRVEEWKGREGKNDRKRQGGQVKIALQKRIIRSNASYPPEGHRLSNSNRTRSLCSVLPDYHTLFEND